VRDAIKHSANDMQNDVFGPRELIAAALKFKVTPQVTQPAGQLVGASK
jgi:hypothetical protein